MCNGALVAFEKASPAYSQVLEPWVRCAHDRECIAPVYGSGRGSRSLRGNHRQDQAALSFIAYRAGWRCESGPATVGVALHVDKQLSCVEREGAGA